MNAGNNQDKLLYSKGDEPNLSMDMQKSAAPQEFIYTGEIKRRVTANTKDEFDVESDNTTYGCYQNTIQSCGDCCGFFRTWLPCVCCCTDYPWQVVQQSQQALMQRFGKYVRTLDPGLHYVNPCTEKLMRVDLKIEIIDLVKQVILTKDNITILIDASVYYRIINPRKATYRISNLGMAVSQLTFSTLRCVCGIHTLQEILEKRKEITHAIHQYIEEHVEEWGIVIENVFMKDIVLNKDLQDALSTAAKERRLAESKVISAKADVESAKMMREAAEALNTKSAMQIRYYETIQNIVATPNAKTIFLPLETRFNANAEPGRKK